MSGFINAKEKPLPFLEPSKHTVEELNRFRKTLTDIISSQSSKYAFHALVSRRRVFQALRRTGIDLYDARKTEPGTTR